MRQLVTSVILILAGAMAQSQTVSMDFTRTGCNGTEHQLYTELNEGKVVVLEYIMLGCSSCILATDQLTKLIAPLEASHPGRVRQYIFGFIKNYNCTQLTGWQSENSLGGTLFEDGSSQVGYYGGMGMPTIVVTATNNHTVLYRKLGFEPSDTTQIQAAIQAGLQYNPQAVGDDLSARGVKIYPTVFTTLLNIDLPSATEGSLVIYDIAGKEAARKDFSATSRITFDNLDLKPGLFFVVVNTKDGYLGTGKVIRK